jgi:uncharacterized membrane protein YhaH (DUF805 family)
MKWYITVWRKYADFSGRARRKEYWMFTLFNFIITMVLTVLVLIPFVGFILMGLYGLALIIPALAVTVRRLHDLGKSGWWYFITFIPLIGGIWLFVLTCLNGQAGANQYGPDPKA